MRKKSTHLRLVAAQLAGVPGGLNGGGVLRQPAFDGRPELHDGEEQRNQDGDGEGRLEGGEAALASNRAGQRTACIWVTRA